MSIWDQMLAKAERDPVDAEIEDQVARGYRPGGKIQAWRSGMAPNQRWFEPTGQRHGKDCK